MITGNLHLAMMYDGYEIACELHGRLVGSGLYDASTVIYVTILGDYTQYERLKNSLLRHWPKYELAHFGKLVHCEWPTLLYMKEHVHEEDQAWYCHTKGASNCTFARDDVPDHIKHNVTMWRDLMSHYVINQWETCQRIVKDWDACGALYNPGNETLKKHFAGNFFWANGRHLKSLPMPSEADLNNRNVAETFITSAGSNFYNLYSAPSNVDYYGFNGNRNPFGDYKRELKYGY